VHSLGAVGEGAEVQEVQPGSLAGSGLLGTMKGLLGVWVTKSEGRGVEKGVGQQVVRSCPQNGECS
jgi:hypothetical protein